jgi:hypothetical protein
LWRIAFGPDEAEVSERLFEGEPLLMVECLFLAGGFE